MIVGIVKCRTVLKISLFTYPALSTKYHVTTPWLDQPWLSIVPIGVNKGILPRFVAKQRVSANSSPDCH